MSRRSDAKKARRRKRQARAVERTSAVDPQYAEIAEEVGELNSWLVGRGWLLDEANATDDVVSWVYPPSAADVEDDREPVTRIWLELVQDGDDAVGLQMGALLVGTDAGGLGAYQIDPELLPEQIGTIETYRRGGRFPVLD